VSAPRIVIRDENEIQAIRDGDVVAHAKRKSAGSLWSVVLMDQKAFAPHVKISRHLPKDIQRQLVVAVLRQS
jgi:hypothetical protein